MYLSPGMISTQWSVLKTRLETGGKKKKQSICERGVAWACERVDAGGPAEGGGGGVCTAWVGGSILRSAHQHEVPHLVGEGDAHALRPRGLREEAEPPRERLEPEDGHAREGHREEDERRREHRLEEAVVEAAMSGDEWP